MKSPLERSSNDSSIVNLITTDDLNKGNGHYADNLAFSIPEDVAFTNPETKHVFVYAPLTQTADDDGLNRSTKPFEKYTLSSSTIKKAALSGCALAATIIILYLWIHVKLVNPLIVEIFEIAPTTTTEKTVTSTIKILKPLKSEWKVEYNLPNGIPAIRMSAEEMKDITNIHCPSKTFALALYVDSNLELAETFLKTCGKNVAYFRVDGSPTISEIEQLKLYVPNAEKLELKANLKLEKGEQILDNPDFIKTKNSDDRIKTLEISGFVTFDDLTELVEVVPLAEELTIKGGEICKSLSRASSNSYIKSSKEACQITWPILQKLRIVETQDCRAMYDLIYSCWNMPSIETLQIRKSIINASNANYITGILDKNRITKVDFADNVCFDDTIQTVPFMCQASPY
ncbi:hypothetical protein Ocin01_10503 [Orchesella cincta]|uniref:Uncharacterized protein n=1 Tax=Orchesella cincta TaxID=48709 RepID=A0A1D2MTF2_ORCCI|nr:hypothetical protein Ocin01_10503 [Orchesella cincta]